MKKLSIIIIITLIICMLTSAIAQEFYPFSEEEVKELANKMKKLETSDSTKTELIFKYKQQINNLEKLIILDSLELNYKDKEIQLYKDQMKKKKLTWGEENDEKIYFIVGFGFALGGSGMVKNVIENK